MPTLKDTNIKNSDLKSINQIFEQHEEKQIKAEVKQTEGFIRASFANQQNSHLSNSLRFADTKAGALVALNGIILPQIVYLISNSIDVIRYVYIAGLIILLVGVFQAFLTVIPRTQNANVPGIIYWENIQIYNKEQFLDKVKMMPTKDYLDAWLENNYYQAVILTSKFKRLSRSFYTCLVAYGCTVAGLIMSFFM